YRCGYSGAGAIQRMEVRSVLRRKPAPNPVRSRSSRDPGRLPSPATWRAFRNSLRLSAVGALLCKLFYCDVALQAIGGSTGRRTCTGARSSMPVLAGSCLEMAAQWQPWEGTVMRPRGWKRRDLFVGALGSLAARLQAAGDRNILWGCSSFLW